MVTVDDMLARARLVLQDDGTRWSDAELVGWLNDAHQAVVSRRPDSHVINATLTCAAGTLQSLPADAVRLVKVVRNIGTQTAMRPINATILDDQIQDWHGQKPTAKVKHYAFDARDPTRFYVYPPALDTVTLEVVYSHAPALVTLGANPLSLDDTWTPALLDFMLYRAFSKDADFTANAQRALAHYQAFATAIGDRTGPDAAILPTPLPQGT